jgi:hypothetical protein
MVPVYSIGLSGAPVAGPPIGLQNSLDSWCVNGQTLVPGPVFYQNAGWNARSNIETDLAGLSEQLINFTLYKLGPTSFASQAFTGVLLFDDTVGGTAFTVMDGNINVVTFNPTIILVTHPAVFFSTIASPPVPCITNRFVSSVGGYDTTPIVKVQGFAKTTGGNPCQLYGVAQSGNTALFATDWSIDPPGTTVVTNAQLDGSVNQNFCRYDPGGVNRIWIPNSPGYVPVTISDNFVTISIGAYVPITFSNGATGVGQVVRPLVGGWLMQGNVLSDSQWYFANYDFSQYWNLKFVGAGPVGNNVNVDVAPVRDAAGNWYTIDHVTGNVFTTPAVTPSVATTINPGQVFPLPVCFGGSMPTCEDF